MKSMITFAMLALASIAWSRTICAQEYNLRTVPATPQAGAPFVAAFDNTDCVIWMLLPDAEPPLVTVQGSLVRLEVDRLNVANCPVPLRTNTLNVPGLPVGSYQLELVAREYLHPGNDILVQAITIEVGPAITISTLAVPADNRIALALLVGLMLGLNYMLSRRRG
jgi:hypothetical protein